MGKQIAKRVLIIGWDAADWRIIHPLMDAGKMPALEFFVNNGVMGNLATLHPVLSPMLWTSIATGKRPHSHGILGFTEPLPDGNGVRPVTNLSRKCKAVWNILSQSGLTSSVVGWWPSHPVEPIAGAMVSNHYQRAVGPLERGWPMAPETVHPPELAESLAECRFHPDELEAEHVLPFVPKAAEIDQDKDGRLASVAKILCEATSIHSAATFLMDETEWDLMAVYYDAIDHFCHGFMKYHPPRRDFVPERDYELYKGVVEAGYRYHDMMLSTLLAKAGEDTAVIIVSDHGFHPDHLRPDHIPMEPAGPAVEHRDLGIIAMMGPGIRKDEIIHGASLLDVTPTVLTLFGLPVGEDMDGKPLLAAFEEPPEQASIPSWEEVAGADGRHAAERQGDPAEAREAMQQLVELGYVEAPDENAEVAAASTARELQFNKARSLMDASLHAQAVPILERLREEEPEELRFGIQLAMCYRALDRLDELRSLVEALIEGRRKQAIEAQQKLRRLAREERERRAQKAQEGEASAPAGEGGGEPGRDKLDRRKLARLRDAAVLDEAALDFLMGFALSAQGELDAALEHLQRAGKSKSHRPVLHVQLGDTYLQMKRWTDAEASFTRASEIDPENPHAQLGICRSLLPRRKHRLAAEAALRAVAILHEYPMAHYCLGVALHRMRRLDRAVEALQVAVSQNPNFGEAHERLAKIYRRRLNDPERAEYHEKMVTAIKFGLSDEGTELSGESIDAPPTEVHIGSNDLGDRFETPISPVIEGPRSHHPGELITIVSGLPRSGTSLMMQMLGAGGCDLLSDGEREADEDNPRGYYELEKVKSLQRNASWMGEAKGKVVKIIAQLLPHLPPGFAYQVIWMDRDLSEVLASQKRMLEHRGARQSSLEEERLAAIFAKQTGRVRSLLQRREVPVQPISYREVVESPERIAQQLESFCGRTLDRGAMVAAVDPGLYRHRA